MHVAEAAWFPLRRLGGIRPVSLGRRVLVSATQHFGEFVGAGDDRGRVQSARLTGQPLDRPGDRDRSHDSTGGAADRGRDGGDPWFALPDAAPDPS